MAIFQGPPKTGHFAKGWQYEPGPLESRIITEVSRELLGQSDFGFARPDVRNSQIRIGLSRHAVDFTSPAGT